MLCVGRTSRLGRDLAFRMRAECVSYGDALISNAAPSFSVIAGKLFSIDPDICFMDVIGSRCWESLPKNEKQNSFSQNRDKPYSWQRVKGGLRFMYGIAHRKR